MQEGNSHNSSANISAATPQTQVQAAATAQATANTGKSLLKLLSTIGQIAGAVAAMGDRPFVPKQYGIAIVVVASAVHTFADEITAKFGKGN